MNDKSTSLSRHVLRAFLMAMLASPTIASASTIRMETSMGAIEIELYDEIAPLTVTNFLGYVNSGAYDGTFIHRSVPGFVIQGGGYSFNDGVAEHIVVSEPVVNEFNLSNTRGTIAMAKLGGDPDSATSEWFINLADNSANLDFQNGGFTVFGQVLGDGMDIVDAIAALPLVNAGGVFSSLPVMDYTGGTIQQENLLMVNGITAVPLPAAAWLLGFGLMGLLGIARRKTI